MREGRIRRETRGNHTKVNRRNRRGQKGKRKGRDRRDGN